ncbi:MAG: response regulator [Candidatus Dadabacteria bacterium]|nr:MAG: response regulator [Candidatus Dadabacteria bacterium]
MSLASLLFGQKQRTKFPSLVRALSSIVSMKVLEKAVLSVDDWRDLVETAAKQAGKSPQDVAAKVAKKFGLAFADKVPVCDISALESREEMARYRKAGAIPVTGLGRLKGVICSDPNILIQSGLFPRNLPVAFSLWTQIKTALEESERRYAKKLLKSRASLKKNKLEIEKLDHENALPLEGKEEVDKLADKVIYLAIKEAKSYGAKSLALHFLGDSIKYRFLTQDGKKGEGSINAEVEIRLIKHLTRIKNKRATTPMLSKLELHEFRVELIGGNERIIRLSWSEEDYVTKAVIEDSEQFAGNPNNSVDKAALNKATEGCNEGKPRVVIVDDNKTFARVLERFFAIRGFDPQPFVSPFDAAEALTSGSVVPDIIVCDLYMPGMSGVELLEKIKDFRLGRNIPSIILTSDEDPDTEVSVLGTDIDAFVGKDEDPRVLFAHVEKLLRARGKLNGS